jgi:hypothetical protein
MFAMVAARANVVVVTAVAGALYILFDGVLQKRGPNMIGALSGLYLLFTFVALAGSVIFLGRRQFLRL